MSAMFVFVPITSLLFLVLFVPITSLFKLESVVIAVFMPIVSQSVMPEFSAVCEFCSTLIFEPDMSAVFIPISWLSHLFCTAAIF